MNKENIFSIGEVSKMFHVSVSSLRHYEAMGLLTPEYISSDSGYRYYGPEQFEVLNTIRYLRALDMPLSDIKDFLQNKDINLIEEKLQQQRSVVMEKQRELKRIEQKIDHRLNWLSDAKTVPVDSISLVRLPECRIVWIDEPLKIDGFLDMEKPIRKLDQSDAEAVVFLGKIGLGISKEHLCESEIESYDGIFLLLDQEDIYSGETSILPEAMCVRLRFHGGHTEAPEHYKRLLAYIKKHQLQIVGFSREITLIDYGVTNNPDKFVTEICIPVKQTS
ncbi:DNA-binding transcriptional regulator, MerR family [Streptococcus equinus]|uniref:DNA-binding transcriptional regulator, MerR family n=1 Tax=Streptococcus equinus TaxID=1335 RepID=A0A1H0ZRJ4_STREI|nr:MerR family transcriptional regulator [Streptococcus equinus]SDQ30027.1 DNA-binding transcriptional regulator, MerR family [Streptococcus equinus]